MAEGDFPSWRYGPDGASAVFEREEDVPAGWADHPCKVKGGDPPAEAEEAKAELAKFDHDGDGKVGGSKPRRKVKRRVARK